MGLLKHIDIAAVLAATPRDAEPTSAADREMDDLDTGDASALADRDAPIVPLAQLAVPPEASAPAPIVTTRIEATPIEPTRSLEPLDLTLPRRDNTKFKEDERATPEAANAAWVAYCSTPVRARTAIETCLAPGEIDGMNRCACPACPGDDVAQKRIDKSLAYQLAPSVVLVRCLAGCEHAEVSAAFRTLILGLEKHLDAQAEARDRAREATLADERAASLAAKSSITSIDAVPDQRWLVPAFLGADMLTILGGTSGDGKTYESMHVAICVAGGIPWFGRPVERARVLLVLLEGAAADRKARLHKLARGLGVNLADLDGKLDLYPQDLKADDPASLGDLEDYVARLGYGLIVIDNLSEIRSMGGHGAENDTATMTLVLRPLAKLACRRQLAILLLHHSNARGELRGSSAIRQHADAVFEMDRQSAANDSPVTLTRTKDRTGLTFLSLKYRLVDDDRDGVERRRIVPELVGAAPQPTTAVATTETGGLTRRQLAILDAVKRAPGQLGLNAIATEIKSSKRDVTKDLAFLVEDGSVRADEHKKYWLVED